MAAIAASRWIAKSRAQKAAEAIALHDSQRRAKIRLLCLPPAGTGAWVYQNWWKSLPEFVEVLPIELPGRALRMKEDQHTCIYSLVHSLLLALSPVLQDLPYAIFGHSMGAWVAFEMAQEAKHMGLPLPAVLIVSGNRAPHLAGPHHDVDPTTMHSLSFADFWIAFEGRYGPNADLTDGKVRQMIWPMLQADFKLVETYKGASPSLLPYPLIAVGALQDKRYTADQVSAWRLHSQDYTEYWVEGQHDYISKSAQASGLLDIISSRLSSFI